MPKPKLTTLPKLEEWKAPWEVTRDAEGNETPVPEDEQDIDAPKLKKYLYGLLNDKLSLRSQVDELTAEAEEQQQKLADAKTPEELTRLQEENARLVKERDDAKKNGSSDANIKALKLEVALDKGLTKRQALRLVGGTKEELEEDADALLAEFGTPRKDAAGGDEEEEGGVARGPRKNLRNGGDPGDRGKPDEEKIDHAEIVRKALANR